MSRFSPIRPFVGGLFLLLVLGAKPANAAVVYMGPNEACKNLRQAFAAMKGGDTLIIRDGTYAGDDNRIGYLSGYLSQLPPSGTSRAYTVVRAENEGRVEFVGDHGALNMFHVLANADVLSYVEFHGLKWLNTSVYVSGDVTGGEPVHHVKWFRCGAKWQGAGDSSPWTISSGSDLLFEECYAWGKARTGFLICCMYNAGAGQAKRVILRRCVVRLEDVDAAGTIQAFFAYWPQSVEFQNCISIDWDDTAWSNWYYSAASFADRNGVSALGLTSKDLHFRGCLALHTVGAQLSTYGSNSGLGISLGSADASLPNSITDCVLWDVEGGIRVVGANVASLWPVSNLTVKTIDDPNYNPGGDPTPTVGHGSFGIFSNNSPGESLTRLRNSVFLPTQKPTVWIANTDYNAVQTDGTDFWVAAGTHDYCDNNSNKYDPLTGLPGSSPSANGNGVSALKYITRIESGSNLHRTGEDGANRGATIVKRYGVSGTLWGETGYNTLTDEDLWPFPYEEQIRADFRSYVPVGGSPDPHRGFCADGQTLTNYVWGYLGNAVPPLDLVATPGSGSVTLNWATPADIALPTITGFNIYRVDGGQRLLLGTVDGNATYTATVTGLDSSASYAFAMTTLDSQKGESGLSEVATIGTPDLSTVGSPSGSSTPTKTTPTIAWATPAAITAGTALSSTQLNATANVAGTFVYSPAAGTMLAAGTYTLTATFTPSDATLYTTATAYMSLTVNPVSRTTPTISWATPAAITAGTPLSSTQLNATASVAGTFVYSPAAGAVLSAGTQTLTANFTPTNTALYNSASTTRSLTVNAVTRTTPTITWATPAAVTAGDALSNAQLNATASVAGTFAYSPAAGTVLSAGTRTLTAAFTPANTTLYNTTAATRSLTVNAVTRTTPTITWATPATVVVGTALSATQLNATASVAGTFVYTPPSGTVMTAAGSQVLSVTFTPTDTTRYTTATAAMTLQVTAASTFQGPASGGGWSGTIRGTYLLYNGVLYPVVNGRVNFPDCTTYIVAPNGALAGGSVTRNCTSTSGTGQTTPTIAANPVTAATTFQGPKRGGGWSGTIRGTSLLYNGVLYPIVNGRVNFPDCTTYIVAPNGALAGGSVRPNCTPTSGTGQTTPTIAVTQLTAATTFHGPASGGGWSATIRGTSLLYNGVPYPIVNGRVNFPDCTTYIVAPNGALAGGSVRPNCTPTSGTGQTTPTITAANSTESPGSTTTAADSSLPMGAPYTLTLTRSSGGTIQGAGTSCGTSANNCSVTMPAALLLGLQATPDKGYVFSAWTGHCSGTSQSCTVALDGPRTCGAVFVGIANSTQ